MSSDLYMPSYGQGFAASADESAHPGLWKGQGSAWVPPLGVTGDTLFDSFGYKNHGTLTNGPTWVMTEKGWALRFDGGSNRHVLIGDQPSLPVLSDKTIIALVRPTGWGQGSYGRIYDHGYDAGGSLGWTFYLDNAAATESFVMNHYGIGGGATADSNSVTLNEWQMLAAVNDFSAKTVAFYVDGVPAGTDTYTVTPGATSNPAVLGFRYDDSLREFAGDIGPVYLYNRMLTAAEIMEHVTIELAPFVLKRRSLAKAPVAAGTILPQMLQLSS